LVSDEQLPSDRRVMSNPDDKTVIGSSGSKRSDMTDSLVFGGGDRVHFSGNTHDAVDHGSTRNFADRHSGPNSGGMVGLFGGTGVDVLSDGRAIVSGKANTSVIGQETTFDDNGIFFTSSGDRTFHRMNKEGEANNRRSLLVSQASGFAGTLLASGGIKASKASLVNQESGLVDRLGTPRFSHD
jgi:hypothetical protein